MHTRVRQRDRDSCYRVTVTGLALHCLTWWCHLLVLLVIIADFSLRLIYRPVGVAEAQSAQGLVLLVGAGVHWVWGTHALQTRAC